MKEKKYITLSKHIESAIQRKEFSEKLPGVVKLAEMFESNPRTISKALQLLEQKGKVTINGTRGTYISGENQRPSFRIIGVIGLTSRGSLNGELEAIQSIASQNNYRVVALSENKELDQIIHEDPEFLVNFPADGFIFAYSSITENIVATLRQAGIPFVSMNYVPDVLGVNWIDFDSQGGFKRVLSELTALGHRKIAFFQFKNLFYDYSQKMYETYRDFMTQLGGFDERFYYCPYTLEEYYAKHGENSYLNFAQEIVEYVMALKTRPTAISINSSTVAIKVCELFKKAGLKVPGDISITGEFGHQDQTGISGVLFDYSLRAAKVAETITGLLKNPDTPLTQKIFEAKWRSGNTTGPVCLSLDSKSVESKWASTMVKELLYVN